MAAAAGQTAARLDRAGPGQGKLRQNTRKVPSYEGRLKENRCTIYVPPLAIVGARVCYNKLHLLKKKSDCFSGRHAKQRKPFNYFSVFVVMHSLR